MDGNWGDTNIGHLEAHFWKALDMLYFDLESFPGFSDIFEDEIVSIASVAEVLNEAGYNVVYRKGRHVWEKKSPSNGKANAEADGSAGKVTYRSFGWRSILQKGPTLR